MINAYSVEQIRAAEARAPGDLMQRAAAGLAAAVLAQLTDLGSSHYGASVLIVVGSGDNGGDALFAGVRLAARGVRVHLCRVADRVHDPGWQAVLAAGARPTAAEDAVTMIGSGQLDLVVDGILGIGGRSGLRAPAAQLAAACAMSAVPVLAVDLPSGLAADSCGVPDAAFRATRTVSFGGLKLCHLIEPAASRCGRVDLVDIGLDLPGPALGQWQPADLRAVWPVPDSTSDKYARGVVGIDTGSDSYPGAAILSTLGAVHAGAGMVRYLGADRPARLVNQLLPNVVLADGRVQAWLLGSGWGDRPDADRRVAEALRTGLPVVLDADALSHLPDGTPGADRPVLLTPHAGELARLLEIDRSQVRDDPVAAVRAAVVRTGATVLLKGATQYVAGPDSDLVTTAVPGPAWTAQAGSGDTLAGVCAALLAAGLTPGDAALAGASIQALTAADHPGPLPPQELIGRLADTLQRHVLP